MKSWLILSLSACLAVSAFGQPAPAKSAPAKAIAAKPAPLPPPEPKEDGLYANIRTSMGDMTVKFFEKESPITVKNFVDLASGRKAWTNPKTGLRAAKPLYNGLIFHRVLPGFMAQGGDPTGTGMGGTDKIKDEFDPTLKFDIPGRLAMANAGPNTGSCQFFITEVPTPHLNGKHTIFGQVVANQPLVAKITGVPANGQGRPNTPVRIVKIDFERWGAGKLLPLRPPAVKPAVAKKAAPAAKKAAAPVKK
ncbi:MAG TPA: peptidylprolyl isomerase [Bryobacteraceae bacterium]|nr:peptidylprolyl isomerase [Bryobacteraceae bacterium]